MTTADPRELLDAYAGETDFDRGDLLDDREHSAPKAFAALQDVLTAHAPKTVRNIYPGEPGLQICDECDAVWPCRTAHIITTALTTQEEA